MLSKTIVLAILGFTSMALALPTDTTANLAAVPQLTAEDCWRLDEHDRESRRECRDFNDNCRHHDEHDWRGPEMCHGHYYKKRATLSTSINAEACWKLPEHDRREKHECEDFNRLCRHSDEPRWKLPESCDGHYYE